MDILYLVETMRKSDRQAGEKVTNEVVRYSVHCQNEEEKKKRHSKLKIKYLDILCSEENYETKRKVETD